MAAIANDIQERLKKGLTGWEIGKLVLQDSVEVDHGRNGFLSNKDLIRIKRNIRTREDMEEYNVLIDTYRIIIHTILESRILILETKNIMMSFQEYIYQNMIDIALDTINSSAPLIVTEKQYKDIKEKVYPVSGFAIIQDPQPHQLDEKGYYAGHERTALGDITAIKRIKEDLMEGGYSIDQVLYELYKNIRNKLRAFLAIKSIIASVSDLIGVNFNEDLDELYKDIDSGVKIYNIYINSGAYRHFKFPKCSHINLVDLKPPESSLRYYRERLAMSLGNDWWKPRKTKANADSESEAADGPLSETVGDN